MTRYVLIPGAGGAAWYFSRIVPLLEAARHQAVAVDLPGDDETAGLAEYTRLVVDAAAGADDVVLVAQSLGGFTAPLVCSQVPVRSLVLVNAMIPAPGETAGAWWGNVGAVEARVEAADDGGYPREFDEQLYFLHDVAPEVAAEGLPHQRPEADVVFGQACRFEAWPDIPISVVVGRDDRFFPAAFQQRVAHERLGLDATLLPGGHLVALANPRDLAAHLLAP